MSRFDNEIFKNFESKIDAVMLILDNMDGSEEIKQNFGLSQADGYNHGDCNSTASVNENNFLVKVRDNRTIINKFNHNETVTKRISGGSTDETNTMSFMQQMERDVARRAEIRKENEKVAHGFRILGNEAFHNSRYELAINMYTKAIELVKDSRILFINRALSYIKLALYKRAIIDCDYVINKLDEKNLRAWLGRAAAYYYMNDDYNFDISIKMAKKTNPNEIQFIDKTISDINDNFIVI